MSDNGTTVTGSIRATRRSLGLSQERLARLADCSTIYVRLIEKGYVPAHSDVLPRVIQALKEAEPGAINPDSAEPADAGGGRVSV